MEFEEGVAYRLAFGLAYRIAEARKFSAQTGRYRGSAAAGGGIDAILAEVRRQLEGDGLDGATAELIREAVEDALAGRRPQW